MANEVHLLIGQVKSAQCALCLPGFPCHLDEVGGQKRDRRERGKRGGSMASERVEHTEGTELLRAFLVLGRLVHFSSLAK